MFCSCLGWFCAYYLPVTWATVQPEKRRTSKYLSQLEGRHGYIRTKEEHERYLAGEEVPHSKGHGGH